MDRSFMWWIRQHEGRIFRWAFIASLVYFAVGMTCLALVDDEPPTTGMVHVDSFTELEAQQTARAAGAPTVVATPPTVVAPAPAPADTAGDIYKRRCAGTTAVRPGHRVRIDASRSMSCPEARRLVRRAAAGTASRGFTCDEQDPGAWLCTANDGREVDTTPLRG